MGACCGGFGPERPPGESLMTAYVTPAASAITATIHTTIPNKPRIVSISALE